MCLPIWSQLKEIDINICKSSFPIPVDYNLSDLPLSILIYQILQTPIYFPVRSLQTHLGIYWYVMILSNIYPYDYVLYGSRWLKFKNRQLQCCLSLWRDHPYTPKPRNADKLRRFCVVFSWRELCSSVITSSLLNIKGTMIIQSFELNNILLFLTSACVCKM